MCNEYMTAGNAAYLLRRRRQSQPAQAELQGPGTRESHFRELMHMGGERFSHACTQEVVMQSAF